MDSEFPKVFAAAGSDTVRSGSSSGGVFALLAENVIENGGIVYGAAFGGLRSDKPLRHIGTEDLAALESLKGSKYLQSDIGDTYNEIKRELSSGRKVMFTGTPCQTAGLLNIVGSMHDNLLICDFVCSGTPPASLFTRWLKSLEQKYGSPAANVCFRDKSMGWKPAFVRVDFENGEVYHKQLYETSYGRGFGMGLTTAPACGTCRFTGFPRKTDITLGDFWGLEPDNDDLKALTAENKGISLVLLNNEKGARAFGDISGGLRVFERSLAEAVKGNPRLTSARGVNVRTEAFFNDMKKMDYVRLEKKYLKPPPALLRAIARMLRKK